MVIGEDFIRHVGEGNRGGENGMGRFDIKDRNTKGQMVSFRQTLQKGWKAKRMEMAAVNALFQKTQEHRLTMSGGRIPQVDYICR